MNFVRRGLDPERASTRKQREVHDAEGEVGQVVDGTPPFGALVGDRVIGIRAGKAHERAGELVDRDRKRLVRRHGAPPVGDGEDPRQRREQRVDRCFPFDLFLTGFEDSVARPSEDQVERRLGAVPGNVERAAQIIVFGAGKLSQ